MTKIGCFEYSGGVGEWFVNKVNILRSYSMDQLRTFNTHVSFLFNIINIIGCKLSMNKSVGKLSHSAPYTQ